MYDSQDDKARLIQQKNWEDTIISLIQNLVKIKRKYIAIADSPDRHINQADAIQVIKTMLVKLKHIMMMCKNEILIESLKFFHEIILIKPETLSEFMETIFDVIGVIKSSFVEVRQDSKGIKMIINKFIPEVLEIINDIFSPSRYYLLNPNRQDYSRYIFEILEKVYIYNKHSIISILTRLYFMQSKQKHLIRFHLIK